MICDLEALTPASHLYRIGRGPDPWAWPDWAYSGVYDCVTPAGDRAFHGIYYRSRYGDQLENWALFEPVALVEQTHSSLLPDDPEFAKATALLGLTVASS